ncbi:hypothetical protein SmJEL517_g02035 [Synchytrium microbalum]|uniref:Ribosomal RNA large subunit methyltransferase K/L-like methyltransferase domain-containing protein n=1 Tax=Synchytrium microbalum TaxID=1806994 RepID=A0A507CD37_9FUNG|nr:uncharacterized protein SmJEL517_g02035 [Synchytrium microbalum]TPX35453.1 hypothetical protein SmJEL517_g02035 [Synchytrium microbalum]
MNWKGPVDLNNPNVEVVVLEHWHPITAKLIHVYVGRLISEGNSTLVNAYDNSKRTYLGITTMDAELSLISANIALARPGTLICDPFVGTGAFLFSASNFGAYSFGCDIDGRQMRGKDGKGIEANVAQYNLESTVLGCFVTDMAHHPWAKRRFLDAIICDPPYGVRAGAKKIGKTEATTRKQQKKVARSTTHNYPLTQPYEIDQVLHDLVTFAAQHLIPKGRLVYWLPVANEILESITDPLAVENPEIRLQRVIPQHENMRLVSVSTQLFGKWQRLLVCQEYVEEMVDSNHHQAGISLNTFRDLYFAPSE